MKIPPVGTPGYEWRDYVMGQFAFGPLERQIMADKHPSDGRDNSSAAGWAQRRTDVPDLPGYKGGVTGSRVNGDVRSQMTARRRAVNEGPGWKESQNKRS